MSAGKPFLQGAVWPQSRGTLSVAPFVFGWPGTKKGGEGDLKIGGISRDFTYYSPLPPDPQVGCPSAPQAAAREEEGGGGSCLARMGVPHDNPPARALFGIALE